jgi:hypothetical protein
VSALVDQIDKFGNHVEIVENQEAQRATWSHFA